MSQSMQWRRPFFQQGGGDALVLYLIFGQFPDDLRLRSHLGGEAVMKRTVVQRSKAGQAAFPSFALHGYFGASLDEQLMLRSAVNQAPHALIVRGDFSDPATLDYLLGVNELVALATENGAVGMLDMMSFRWWALADWLTEVWQKDAPSVFPQVNIYTSTLGEGIWVRTRGLRAFGRPDLSVRKLSPEQVDPTLSLVNSMIEFQALGGRIQSGQSVQVEGLPSTWRFALEGDLEDPTYNNTHWEIG